MNSLILASQREGMMIIQRFEQDHPSVTWKDVFIPPMERLRLRLPRDVDTTTFARMHLIRELGGKCSVCGSKNDLEIHHIIPRSEGGPTSVKNLTPLCE